MPHLISNFHYRPEIDGLRAVAVLAVIFFHAGLSVTGGYIGVDVFFVISGFLITSLIIKDLEGGTFTLANFWERRVRRIIPAMVVVVVATLVAGWFLLLPSDYESLGRSAVWQAIFAANIYFWLNTGYFAGSAEGQPLLHTWSLAVEEQYYVLVPLLLLGLFRMGVFHRRNVMLLLCAAGIAISLVVSVYGVERHPSAAFYLLPTRAWELLCGAFVALIPSAWILRTRLSREVVSFLGISCILIPCCLYTKATPFPGLAALLPCIGTAMYIWASTSDYNRVSSELPLVARLLSLRPIVFIGLISYSLYLWHWPLIAISNYWALEPRTHIYSFAILGVSFLLAVLTWHYVETPFRKRILFGKRSGIFAFGFSSIVIVLAFGVVVISGNGFPSRFSPEVVQYAKAKEDMLGTYELNDADIQGDRLIHIGSHDSQPEISLLLWGDSHAMAASPAFDQFLKTRGLAGLQATASATPPILGGYWKNNFTSPEKVISFNRAVYNYIKQHQIPNVILVAYWEYYTDERGAASLDTALIATVKKLVETGTHPWVMLQVPHPHFDVPKGLVMASIFNYDLSPLMVVADEWNGLYGEGDSILKRVEAAGGRVLDPRQCFMDKAHSRILVEKNGTPLFRDTHHLSAMGAKLVLLPCLNKIFTLDEMYHRGNNENHLQEINLNDADDVKVK